MEVCEINNAEDPTFDGLHPEPIPPWVDRCIAKVPELGYDAGFINDATLTASARLTSAATS